MPMQPSPMADTSRLPDLLDRAAPALGEAATGRHDQGLAERVGVPRRPGARLEGDAGPDRAGRGGCPEQGVDADRTGKPLGRSFPGGL
jgi:hypothetical protein